MPHEASDINIPHPLHILGGGFNPEDTQITAPPGADCALSFSASCKVAMLAVSATLCPCLVHRRGFLTVERCKLSSDPRGLLHLVSPVVTLAAGSSGAAALGLTEVQLQPTATAAASPAWLMQVTSSSSSSSKGMPGQLKPSAGTGRLVIVECRLQGGSTAVRCGGTGRLRDVRVIYESRAAVFWLEVDSADPGWCLYQQQQQQQQEVAMQYSQLQQQQELLAQQPVQQQQMEVVRASKAKEWQHCRTLGTSSAAVDYTQQHQGQVVGQQGALTGLARIQAVLGKRVNPAMLAAHLGARKQQVQSPAE